MDLSEAPRDPAQRHPWEVVRANFFRQLLERMWVIQTTKRWLDVGSGDAFFARELISSLPSRSEVVCWDINYTDDAVERFGDGESRLHFATEAPEGHFDGVLLLDVIEHVPDDESFVSNIVENLMARGAWALVSVPAYPMLFSSHDVALSHYRRYTPSSCVDLLERSGLTVVSRGGLFHALLAARLAQVLVERRRRSESAPDAASSWNQGPVVTHAITRALRAEARLSLSWGSRTRPVFPGLSFWAFCRRTKDLPT